MKTKNQIIIFIKNPEKGKVKTRLAATIGDEKAVEIYLKMIKHTLAEVAKCNAVSNLFYSEKIEQNYSADNYFLQEGQDLGSRMNNAFEKCLGNQSAPTLIIGTDCPQISNTIILEAFNQLNNNTDVVIGPAFDGGYYLLGMKKPHPELFLNMEWSTKNVFSETVNRLKGLKLSYYLLETLRDIDTEEDLRALPKDFGYL